jgi:hypothetical protein
MLSTHLKCAHEPFEAQNLSYILRYRNNEISEKDTLDFLKLRDYWMGLEVEVAHYLYILCPYILKLYPDAKFILTVREPLSWAKSEMKKNLNAEKGIWAQYQKVKYAPFHEQGAESPFKQLLYPLHSYFRYYNHHIKFVLDHVPKENLLVLDTYDISSSQEKIASFIGLPPNSLQNVSFHSGKGKKKDNVENIINSIPDKTIIDAIKSESLEFIKNNVPFLLKRMDYLFKNEIDEPSQ